MKKVKQTLSLDRPATYQIKVPGRLGESWADWGTGLTLAIEGTNEALPVTVLTGSLDQAALQGLLRRLYTLGAPLISVVCMEYEGT